MSSKDEYDWNSYHQLNETYIWLRSLPKKYPGIVSIFTIGKSFEDRPLLGVRISFQNVTRPGIFIEGGIHAREWISPATVTYIINQLLTGRNVQFRKIAENFVWHLIPHINPDGYVYTHTDDRLWRKTRSHLQNFEHDHCYGVDPNRNWNINWNNDEDRNSCSDSYPGLQAFSEIEIQSLANYLLSIKGQIHLYLSIHSFAQILLHPYGYKSEQPSNNKDLKKISNAAVNAIKKSSGTRYTSGSIYHKIHAVSGSSVDWVYDVLEVKLAFAYELRPHGNAGWDGFLLPSKDIIPIGKELLDSIIALINEAEKLNYFKDAQN